MRKAILLSLTLFIGFLSNAQRTCGTMHHEQVMMQQDLSYGKQRQQIEQFTQQFLASPAAHSGRAIVTIPVVVHVVYHDSAQNVSMAQIQSQINSLNLDYSKTNTDTSLIPAPWKSIAANCEIQFCLAQRDPSGNATNGVVRVRTNSTSFLDDDKVKYAAQGGDNAWNSSLYLNLWVCKLGNSLLGYAQFPGGTAATDGVVINYTAFGTIGTAAAPYNKGRTATHEVGHWLNLYHIWGDDDNGNGTCTASTECSGSDLVGDTPNQCERNYGCPTYPLTDGCTTSSPGVMFMNYMDYTDDACMYFFTTGQKARMTALFASGGTRFSLTTSQGCVAPGNVAPTASFTGNPTTICAGQTVTFTNTSTGNPTSYLWTFTGGSPATSTSATPPAVTYSAAGTYTVSLQATNANGSNTSTQTNYITVLNSTALPLTEGFQNTTFPPTNWSLNNPDNSKTWARATTAGGYGASSASAYVDNYNYNAAGQRDWLYTPTLSFTGISAGKLKWDRAYALDASNPTFADSLEVLYSVNCGQTWTSLWKKGGATLATATGITNTFTPTAAQWKSDTVDLSSLNGQASVRFAFVNINRYGNTLFLDNINIYNATTSCNKPVAAFTASPTTVTAGSTVTFTDQSTNTPTSWAWTFGGGTPATSALQVPGAITYNTPGTYTAKLRATNSCGSDSTTVTITVISSTPVAGCDTFTNLTAADTAFALYRYAGLVGYISGHNSSGDIAKAEKFANAMPASYKVTGGLFAFGWAKTTNTGKTITATVWDANGAGGAPGTVLGSKTIPISSIYTNVNGTPYSLTPVTFTTPISVGANYYLGFQMTYSNGDSVAVLTTTLANNGNHHQQGWERWDDSTWHSYDSAYTISLSNYILPIMCSQANAPVAGFKANPTTICAGGSVTFTDTSSNTPTSWSWSFPGGTPSTSSAANPTVVYNAAGTYNVTLTVSNANGNNAVTKTGYITVRANPVLATSSVPVSCFGGSDGSASVTATVATGPYTYNWSGGGTTSSITNKPTGSYTVTVTDGSGSLCTATATVSISQPLSALTAAATATGAYCGNSNGTASVTAAGGNGSFTYVWSNTQTSANLTGLAVGTYTVTVKDAKNCTATASAAITAQTQTITLTISKTDATCGGSNGQAAVAMSGSSIGASYHWSNGAATGSISNVTAGTYTVTVTSALGCTATASTVINNIAGPTLSTSVTPVSCFGGTNGSASVTATGGTPTITYNWSNSGGTANSIAGKPAGTYAVTVTDGNSCTATASVVITQPAAAVTASASAVTAYCGNSNGSATVTAAGGNGGYTYVWSNAQTNSNLTNVAAGVYTVTVKDSKNCSATATTTVGNQTVSITISISKTDALCGSNNGTATASSSTSGLTYIWSNGGSGAALTGLSTNTYTVTGTDSHGCSATASVTITNTNGTTLSTSTTPVSCNGGSDGGAAVTATGGSGSYTYIWSNGATTAALTGKTAGTYTVTVGDGTSCQPTASVTISQPSVITAAATPTTAYCGNANGSAIATASGGNGGFTYLWSNSQNTATAINLAAGTYGVTIHDSKNCSASANAVVGNQVVSFTLTTSKTDAACGSANGSATASSATTGLTFVWSNGGNTATISSVASGTYTVTATETHGCTATASVTVNNASGASLSTSFTPVSCFNGTNGSASVSATGGSGTYTYSWSGGGTGATISNKPAGTYTVTVSDGSGCAPTASVVITQPAAALSGSTSTIPATCGNANGSATVTAVGGNGGYTYHWSNNQNSATASNLLAASYQVTISDSKNCTATASANVANSGAASVTPTTTPVSCFNGNNGQISTAVSGGTAPYHYSWSTGDTTASVSGLIPGQYTVSVTDASGCVTTASSTLNNPAAISVSATKTDATSNSANNGTASAIASGGTGSLVYNWSNSMTGANITGLAPGTYTVTVKDANNCTATANVTVGVNTAVIDINGNVMLRIVPNPADEVVTVSAKAEQVQPATIKIYNSIGQLISSRNVAASDHFEEAFDVRELSSGVYQIHLQYGKVEKVERFLKK
ncbi:MAG: PKD domain-containing protein [Chitinophagales bacterium]